MSEAQPQTLRIVGLCLEAGQRRIVDEVSLEVGRGEIVGVVGESGSGKSQTALAVAGLTPPGVRRAGGAIWLGDLELTGLTEAGLREVRGRRVAYVFQEPMSALNPTKRIGRQLGDILCTRHHCTRGEAERRAAEMLEQVRIADPRKALRSYPFQLSGGMRQRVLIAAAFACEPDLIVADEPTTALDVTVQAQVLHLLRELAQARGVSVLFISHDLAVIRQVCSRVYVMQSGRVVESGEVDQILGRPAHPYTRLLIASSLELPESVA